VFATLRQRHYLGLFALSLVIAAVCAAAGTWQIARFEWKRHTNHDLRTNNHDQADPVASVLGPAADPTSTGKLQQFRHVTATGTYLDHDEVLVRGQSVGGDVGYLILTPLKTADGTFLVVRGFVQQTAQARDTPTVSPAPEGTVTVTARLEATETRSDQFGKLPNNQVESINDIDQAQRLNTPVWPAYGELLAGQPGTAGLTTIPDPDLSNPAGGADEPQHAAYVVQWYLFGGLALALPFVLAAAERRREAEEDAVAAEEANTTPATRRSESTASEPMAPAASTRPPAQGEAVGAAPEQGQSRVSIMRANRRKRRDDRDDRLAGRS
jgi:cytochrome oxidase assembly protein ShyY1